jgi:hypothetical protein
MESDFEIARANNCTNGPTIPRESSREQCGNIPLQALVNFSVTSWILGSKSPRGLRSDCLKGRSAGVVAWAMLPEACTCDDAMECKHK